MVSKKNNVSVCSDPIQDQLYQWLEQQQLNTPEITLIVGFSGGLDSSVLLHALSQLRSYSHLSAQLHAVHVNHGLQAVGDSWLDHCREVSGQCGVVFHGVKINARASVGESPEASARNGRYQALSEYMVGLGSNSPVLLTAHHQDDQAETLILQLMRGAGLAGLSAMPAVKSFSCGQHGRPLLGVSRKELLAYAEQNQLVWVDDPSNSNNVYSRNYLRNEVMPKLHERWPAANKTISRSAGLLAEQQELIKTLLEDELGELVDGYRFVGPKGVAENKLSALIRLWLEQLCVPIPSKALINELLKLLSSAEDVQGEVAWGEGESRVYVRSYAGDLYLSPESVEHCLKKVDLQSEHRWVLAETLAIPGLAR